MWFAGLCADRERKIPHANAPFRYRDDGALCQVPRILRDDLEKMALNMLRAHIPQAENHNTGQVRSSGRKQVAKIKIMGEQDSSFVAGFFQYLRVLQTMEALLLQVIRLMSDLPKRIHNLWGDAHVCQEIHAEANSSGWTVSSVSHAAY